jgi:hypothetical protein
MRITEETREELEQRINGATWIEGGDWIAPEEAASLLADNREQGEALAAALARVGELEAENRQLRMNSDGRLSDTRTMIDHYQDAIAELDDSDPIMREAMEINLAAVLNREQRLLAEYGTEDTEHGTD